MKVCEEKKTVGFQYLQRFNVYMFKKLDIFLTCFYVHSKLIFLWERKLCFEKCFSLRDCSDFKVWPHSLFYILYFQQQIAPTHWRECAWQQSCKNADTNTAPWWPEEYMFYIYAVSCQFCAQILSQMRRFCDIYNNFVFIFYTEVAVLHIL